MALVADSKLSLASASSQHHDRLDTLALPPLFDSSSSSSTTETPTSFSSVQAPILSTAASVPPSMSDSHHPPVHYDSNSSAPDHPTDNINSGYHPSSSNLIDDRTSFSTGNPDMDSTTTSPGPESDSTYNTCLRSEDSIHNTFPSVRKKSGPVDSTSHSSLLFSPALPFSPTGRRASDMNVEASPVLSSGAEKRRNKLGYHRTSVACGHCRRRKIRCVVASNEVTGRCTNCIKLRKECIFHPVDQSPPDTRIRHHPVTMVDRMSLSALTSSTIPPSTLTTHQSYGPNSSSGQLRYVPGMEQNPPMSSYSFALPSNYGVVGSEMQSQYSSHPDPNGWNPSVLSTPSLDASSTTSSWNHSKSVSPQFDSSSPISNSQYPPHTGYISSSTRAYPLASPIQLPNQYMSYSYDPPYSSQCRINGSRQLSSTSSFLPPPQDQMMNSRGQMSSDMNSSSHSPSVPLTFSNTGMLGGLGVQSESVSPNVGPFWDTLGNEVSDQSHTPVLPSQWYRSEVSSSGKASSG